MAFCNACGATLNEGTKFCNKCGAAVSGVPAAIAQPIAPGPPPSKGGSSALKVILVIVGVIVLIGVLGMVTCGIVIHRAMKSARVSQKGDNVKVETPFGNMETSTDPKQTAKELGVEIYPGADLRKEGTASVTFGSLHTVTANFESNDSVDKVCDFYKQKFPSAQVASSDQTHCSIVSGDKGNSMTISVQSSGDGSRFTIVSMTKKSQD
jgi:CRISPR/Cas system CMR subunit Cmr4 (Cas7 group RAMP superfamily)